VSEQSEVRPGEGRDQDEEFVPRGAVAFMVFLVASYSAVWLFFYRLMVGRQ